MRPPQAESGPESEWFAIGGRGHVIYEKWIQGPVFMKQEVRMQHFRRGASLDAQREACEAYIKSQAHEGCRRRALRRRGFAGSPRQNQHREQRLGGSRASGFVPGRWLWSALVATQELNCGAYGARVAATAVRSSQGIVHVSVN